MRKQQIELWAASVFERVEKRQPHEDFLVELKADWPNPVIAARQLAGLANAARGEPILWLVGVCETRGVIGAEQENLANWFAQVRAEFDGVYPELTDLNIPWQGPGGESVTVAALLMETDRAPYVVRNPRAGTGGPITWEVPWREGTSVRTARRSDLIRLMVPIQKLPDAQILNATLKQTTRKPKPSSSDTKIEWSLNAAIYLTPTNSERIVIPHHKLSASLQLGGRAGHVRLGNSGLQTREQRSMLETKIRLVADSPRAKSITITCTETETVVDGPGEVLLRAYAETPMEDSGPIHVTVHASFEIAGGIRPVGLEMNFDLHTVPNEPPRWVLAREAG